MINNKGTLDFFSVLVVGDNPEQQMLVFDDMLEVEPYILYKHSDIKKLRLKKIELYNEYIRQIDDFRQISYINDKINELKQISDEEYFHLLSEPYYYDQEGNIISNENPNGRWLTCEKGGRIYSDKLKNANNQSVVSDLKCNINWGEIHLNEKTTSMYKRTWELCVENETPVSLNDETILRNMSPYSKLKYFNSFKDKEEYVNYNSSFFTNAIVINADWFDIENKNYIDWVINFKNMFIDKQIKDNDLITIFECTK